MRLNYEVLEIDNSTNCANTQHISGMYQSIYQSEPTEVYYHLHEDHDSEHRLLLFFYYLFMGTDQALEIEGIRPNAQCIWRRSIYDNAKLSNKHLLSTELTSRIPFIDSSSKHSRLTECILCHPTLVEFVLRTVGIPLEAHRSTSVCCKYSIRILRRYIHTYPG